MAEQKTYTMYRGDTLVLEIVVFIAGEPSSIAGSKIWFTAKKKLTDNDGVAVIQVTTPADIVINPDQIENPGAATITVPASITAALTENELRLFYDIQIKLPTGRVATVERGLLVINPDVTQAIV